MSLKQAIREMFYECETIEDKWYFCQETARVLKELESQLEETEAKSDLKRKELNSAQEDLILARENE